MKRLSEYINKNFTVIYEHFEADHILTEEEINQSFNRVINEGFWSWLGDLIKSLFTDDTSKETKEYCGKALTYFREEWGDNVEKLTTKLLNDKDVKRFLENVEKERVRLVKSNVFKEEEQSYCWAIFTLKQKIKLLTDEKKTSDIKLIDEKIKEYSKNAKDSVQKVEQEINNIELPKEKNNDSQATSQELGDAANKAFEEYKNEIDQLCKKANTTPEQLKNVIFKLCTADDVLKKIADPKILFTFAVMACGGKIAQAFNESNDVIAMYMGTIAYLIEHRELKISDKEV